MTSTHDNGKGRPRGRCSLARRRAATIFFLAGFLLLASAPAAHCEVADRTVAVADFAVRAPSARAVELAWLGAALPELLQAKMQLFSGARVLERLRLPSPDTDLGQTAELATRTVAQVLLLGSVEVQPNASATPEIKVQARAVETESGKVLSEATFAGTTELAGLLRIAEDLARALADGLGFTYTPAQLAYAEPADIDSLKHYLRGNELLADKRPREAVDAFQKALVGNAGKYFAAAHRAQGEAYRALSTSLTGTEQKAVNEQYLKKFKEDALAASGALFDLGTALEANGLWEEAIDAYEDYLRVVGTEGETVRWSFSPEKALAMPHPTVFKHAVSDGERIHLTVANGQPSTDTRWVFLDARTGELLGQYELHKLLGLSRDEAYGMRVFGADAGVAYVHWHGILGTFGSPPPDDYHYGNPWAAAIDPSGRVLWKTRIGTDRQHVNGDAVAYQGRLAIEIQGSTAVLTADGHPRTWYAAEDGAYDLAGDRLVPKYLHQWPTGVAGVTFSAEDDYNYLWNKGKEVLRSRSLYLVQSPLAANPGGWIILAEHGNMKVIAVNPEDWSQLDLYANLAIPTTPLGQDNEYLVFALENDPAKSEIDPRFGMSSTIKGTVVNLVSKKSRTVVGKTFFKKYDWIVAEGHDLIVYADGIITRNELLPRDNLVITPTGEAHLRIAACLLARGDGPGMEEHLANFVSRFPGDPRAVLLTMKRASVLGDKPLAARLGLTALSSGGMNAADSGSCLAAIRTVRPEVRELVRTPVNSRLIVRGMIEPGVLACTPSGPRENKVHLVVDTLRNRTALVQTPELDRGSYRLWYHGKDVYFARDPQEGYSELQLFKTDLLSGKRASGQRYPYSSRGFVPGMPFWVTAATHNNMWDAARSETLLMRFDPDDLHVTQQIKLRYLSPEPVFIGKPMVFSDSMDDKCQSRTATFRVIDPDTGGDVAEVTVPLDGELVAAVTADPDRLLVAINGADFAHYVSGEEGFWFRVESFPLTPGGKRWTYRSEGHAAGNMIIEGNHLSFAAHEGRLPVPGRETAQERWFDACELVDKPVQERAIFEGPELSASRVTLDLGSGRKSTSQPLPANPWDRQPRTSVRKEFHDPCRFCREDLPVFPDTQRELFPGFAWSRNRVETWDAYWPATPDRVPLRIDPLNRNADYHLVLDDYGSTGNRFNSFNVLTQRIDDPVLVWKDTVYEPIGGGVILVKDFAAGVGLERINSILGQR